LQILRVVGAVAVAWVLLAAGEAHAQQVVSAKGNKGYFFISSKDAKPRSIFYVPTDEVIRTGDERLGGYWMAWPLINLQQREDLAGAWRMMVLHSSTLCRDGKPADVTITQTVLYDETGKETYRNKHVSSKETPPNSPNGLAARLACTWDRETLRAGDDIHFAIPGGPKIQVYKDFRDHAAYLIAAFMAQDEMRAGHVQRVDVKMSRASRSPLTITMPKSWKAIETSLGTDTYGLSEHLVCQAGTEEPRAPVTSDNDFDIYIAAKSFGVGGQVHKRNVDGKIVAEITYYAKDSQVLEAYRRKGQTIVLTSCIAPKLFFSHFQPAFRAIADSVTAKN
jgi:hypothetical protein